MKENQEKQLSINTVREQCGLFNDESLKQEIKSMEQKAENIIDWLLATKQQVKAVPITMRKLIAYTESMAEQTSNQNILDY